MGLGILTLSLSGVFFFTFLICTYSNDLDILHSFRQQLDNPNASLVTWNLSNPCSSWEGVSCLEDSFTVTNITLSKMSLTGTLSPSIGNLRNLRYLDLWLNDFRGAIPAEIGNSTNLEYLDLDGNHFTGEIPVSLSNLTRLKILQLQDNSLSGRIPPELFTLSNLEILYLHNNSLSGEIPVNIAQLHNIQYLFLMYNNLTGSIPKDIVRLSRLVHLTLQGNSLSGEIPRELGKNSSLKIAYMSDNMFEGSIPLELCKSGSLERVYLQNNKLQGEIPIELIGCTTLKRLMLQSNRLTGQIPTQVGIARNLTYLDLSHNLLNGSIPTTLNNCKNLTWLGLHNNALSGELPSGLEELEVLNVADNRIAGNLPPQFGSVRMFTLDLSGNMLQGAMPQVLQQLTGLQQLFLQDNQIEGTIPKFLGNLQILRELNMSNNEVNGSIPSELSSLESLTTLDLSKNQLIGNIPPQLAVLTKLEYLDLSHNQLSGGIPSQLGQLVSLTYVNLSYNNLTGPVPEAWSKFSSSSFLGLGNKSCTTNCNGGTPSTVIVIICVTVVCGICLITAVAFLLWRKCRAYPSVENQVCNKLLLDDILTVTGGLSPDHVVGEGGFGTVYKATTESGVTYAVKRIRNGSEDVIKSFMKEWETAGQVRHRNILKPLGFYRHRESALLVYDFLPKGSLGNLLHMNKEPIPWDVRYNIALGSAYGLAYLHYDCVPKILHRDIKPNNILLTNDMVPKIADFGLAKLVEKQMESKSVSGIAGSYGYIAPEYAYTMKVNEKSDVYSFGVVLLELLIRKTPLDPFFMERGEGMSSWATRNPVEVVVDESLWDKASVEEKQQIAVVLKIGLFCTHSNPSARPTMLEVVEMLQRVKSSCS